MKLTTKKHNLPGSTQLGNAFKLKKLIQHAANSQQASNKQNINTNLPKHDSSPSIDADKPKPFFKGIVAVVKKQRSVSEDVAVSIREQKGDCTLKTQLTNLNLGRLQIKPLCSSARGDRKIQFKPINVLAKSTSSKTVSNKKIQGLCKSYRCSASMRQQVSINDFVIGKKLGKGRFGNVYSATEKHTNFRLALKIINKKQLKEADMQEQLVSEIKLQMYMRHPNVLQMYGYFHDNESIYLMLELAEQCLFRELRRKTCFPENEVAYYFKQTLDGLMYLHGESIIHRDLKPENIMLVNNVIKLADFGWSVYSPRYKRQTFCGTLDYVPPEVVKGEYYDERADIWSLGVLVFELTFGYAPFEGSASEKQTFQKIVNQQLVIPSHVSEELRTIIRYVLSKDPRKRLDLQGIDQSSWLRRHAREGRGISSQIWDFWQRQSSC